MRNGTCIISKKFNQYKLLFYQDNQFWVNTGLISSPEEAISITYSFLLENTDCKYSLQTKEGELNSKEIDSWTSLLASHNRGLENMARGFAIQRLDRNH